MKKGFPFYGSIEDVYFLGYWCRSRVGTIMMRRGGHARLDREVNAGLSDRGGVAHALDDLIGESGSLPPS